MRTVLSSDAAALAQAIRRGGIGGGHATAVAVVLSFIVACGPGTPPPEAPELRPLPTSELIVPSDNLVMATDGVPGEPIPTPSAADCAIRLQRPPRSGCNAIFSLAASATGGAGEAARAGDGSSCTVWNAQGFAPQSVTLDMGTPTRIDVIALVPEMSPDGSVSHEVAFSDDGRAFSTGHRVEAPMRNGEQVELVLPRPEKARFVRVTTTKSPSWVAWREVGLFRCGTE